MGYEASSCILSPLVFKYVRYSCFDGIERVTVLLNLKIQYFKANIYIFQNVLFFEAYIGISVPSYSPSFNDFFLHMHYYVIVLK